MLIKPNDTEKGMRKFLKLLPCDEAIVNPNSIAIMSLQLPAHVVSASTGRKFGLDGIWQQMTRSLPCKAILTSYTLLLSVRGDNIP